MSLHFIRCPIDYFALVIIHLDNEFSLAGEVDRRPEVLVYFSSCLYERIILTISLTKFSKDAIYNLAVDMRYIQIVPMPQYRTLLIINRLVNHTFIVGVDSKAPSFELGREILLE